MTLEEQINKLSGAIGEFVSSIDSLTGDTFLKRMDDWSPRDVLAHLIGWNRYTIEGCEQIKRGEPPFYFIDSGDDFSKVNAVSVQRYSSRDRRQLIDELNTSFGELERYLRSLGSAEWKADYGVRWYAGGRVTIKNTIDALISDYVHHREQIVISATNCLPGK